MELAVWNRKENQYLSPDCKFRPSCPACGHNMLTLDSFEDDTSSVMTEKTQSPLSNYLLFSPLNAANTASFDKEPPQSGKGWNQYDLPVKVIPSWNDNTVSLGNANDLFRDYMCAGTSRVEDLIQNNDGYTLHPKTN